MNFKVLSIRPFIFSLGLNMVLYAILTALNILISRHYLLELVKRHHFKSQLDNQIKAGLVQSLFSLIPALVLSTFCRNTNLSYLKTSYSSTLLVSSLITAIVVSRPKKAILIDTMAIRSFAILTPIAAFSFLAIGSSKEVYVSVLILIIAVVGYIIRKLFHSPTTIGAIETEATEIMMPTHSSTDIIRSLLYPFDLVLENLVIIPDSVSKPYSLSIASKTIVSPLSAFFLLIVYFSEVLSLHSVLLMGIISLCTIILLHASSRIRKIRYIPNLYGFLVCALLYYFLFDLFLEASSNAGSLLGLSRMQTAAFLVSPQLAIPSLCVYSHSIRMGFYKRALYATFYSVIFSLLLAHLAESIVLPNASPLSVFRSGDLRVTLMGILELQVLIFANLVLQGGKLHLRNCLLCLYVLIQDCLITSLGVADN